MREILFRGKQKDADVWLVGDLRQWSEHKKGICDIVLKRTLEVDPETVGQFTGLYDKNGKKIFEGDIIKFQINIKTVLTGKIIFACGAFQFETTDPERERFTFDGEEVIMLPENCEVIGNIYDDPHKR